MSVLNITEQQILEALNRVGIERWPNVLEYIDSLQPERDTDQELSIRTAAELAASGLVGIWSHRPDITDSQDFARQLRHQAENRPGHNHAS